MNGLAIGPLVFSADRAPVVIGVAVLMIATALLGRRGKGALGVWAGSVVLWALVTARAGFILQHPGPYLDDPFDILAIWQGGFSPWAGGVGLLGASLWHLRRNRDLILPAMISLGLAGSVGYVTWHLLHPPPMSMPGDIALYRLNGDALMTAEWEGPMVVNLWATWCPPCRREMPMMAGIAADDPAVPLHFVNQGEGPDTIRRYLSQAGLVLSPFLDPGHGMMQGFGIQGLPATLFIDAEGHVTVAHMGEISRAALLAGMEDLKATAP